MVIEYFQNLNVRVINSSYLVHKPLILLIALSKTYKGEKRLLPFFQYEAEVYIHFRKFGNIQVHYPFGRLVNDGLWEIEKLESLFFNSSGDLSRAELIQKNIHGGFISEVYETLIKEKSLICELAYFLLDKYFPPEQHGELLAAVGLLNTRVITTQTITYGGFLNMETETNNELAGHVDKGVRDVPENFLNTIYSVEKKSEVHNHYVDYLNSLSNIFADGSNALAESQALNKYFGDLYVPFPLADAIKMVLKDNEKKDKVIVLTGHAGDGKSTIALDVFKDLKGLPPLKCLNTKLQEHEQVDITSQASAVHIIKDMSELALEDRVKWLDQAFGDVGNWLIVSNTGPLLESFKKFASTQGTFDDAIEGEILAKLNVTYQESDKTLSRHTIESPHTFKKLVILNMTRLNNVCLGASILTKMLEHPGWSECNSCIAKEKCPLQQNRQALQQDHVIERVRWVYQRITEYEKRLTLRQMVAHLAFALTGNITCQQARKDAALEQGLDTILFSESFFGYKQGGLSHLAENLVAVDWIKRMDFGSPFEAIFERKLLQENLAVWLNLPEVLIPTVNKWQRNAQSSEGIRWRFALRRLVYLYGNCDGKEKQSFNNFQDHFLQSPTLRDYDKWQQNKKLDINSFEEDQIKSEIFQVLRGLYSGFSADQFDENDDKLYLTLRRPDNSVVQTTQLVIASIYRDRFELGYDTDQGVPFIEYHEKSIKLSLPLPLLDYIRTCSIGSLGNSLAPIHLNQLEWFRSKLLKAVPKPKKSLILKVDLNGKTKTQPFSWGKNDKAEKILLLS